MQVTNDRARAEELLRFIGVGRQVGAMDFLGSPVLTLMSRGKCPPDLQAFLRLERGWAFTDHGPAAAADEAGALPERPLEELAAVAVRVRWSPIRDLRLGRNAPHLVIEFESGATLVISGVDPVEAWELSWVGSTVEALPGGAGVSARSPESTATHNRRLRSHTITP